ncbi:hypothetical protein I6F30_21930 [Bradyrhizobium sp. NBAIM20]|uniref:hypothetical protein n=1 Tax=unclassified Bradyrhizobium TaxID=2631580 RepID=UPI001CD27195|nr:MULTISPECIES: hypothetical protein [unclassified Bradyrhizobium]MCA1413781.1 hypothetical protein [Bradyrhizobium sp. NBAIM20]MCA1460414.1 hypothetical protein [Bradyrhizobium sp. NBAIM18]
MNRTTPCPGCGHALVPMLTAHGHTEPSCLWCEGFDARATDMAKWAGSPSGKPEPALPRSFD